MERQRKGRVTDYHYPHHTPPSSPPDNVCRYDKERDRTKSKEDATQYSERCWRGVSARIQVCMHVDGAGTEEEGSIETMKH